MPLAFRPAVFPAVSRAGRAAVTGRAMLVMMMTVTTMIVMITGCQPLDERILVGTRWELDSIRHGEVAGLGGTTLVDAESMPADLRRRPYVEFEKSGNTIRSDELFGFTGLNDFFGNFHTSDDGRLTISQMGSMRTAGPPEHQDLEAAFVHALNLARTYRVEDDELVIFYEGDAFYEGGVVRLVRAEP